MSPEGDIPFLRTCTPEHRVPKWQLPGRAQDADSGGLEAWVALGRAGSRTFQDLWGQHSAIKHPGPGARAGRMQSVAEGQGGCTFALADRSHREDRLGLVLGRFCFSVTCALKLPFGASHSLAHYSLPIIMYPQTHSQLALSLLGVSGR